MTEKVHQGVILSPRSILGLEIKPCPFCGASATVEEIPTGLTGISNYTVGCDSKEVLDCYGYQSLTEFATKIEAIKAWNRRAPTEK